MKLRQLSALCLAMAVLICLALPVRAAEDPDTCISQMIHFYQHHGEDAKTDIAYLTQQLSGTDPDQAAGWEKIMDFWAKCNREMDLSQEILPDGLPDDDSLCIVVLGYYLKSNGGMRDELVGRLEAALACAEKYPNAYVACTGGGTAANNSSVTEASQMAKWLVSHGVDESRIIIEDESMSTIQNAQFTTALLSAEYPQIQNLAVVTSDYHVLRGCLYFFTDSILNSLDGTGIAYNVVGHAVYPTGGPDPDDIHTQAEGLTILADVRYIGTKKVPKLAVLEGISVSGDAVCQAGNELDLTVEAVYSNGYRKNVTTASNYSGFDLAQAGSQTVTVSYTEDGRTYRASFDIEMTPAPTQAPLPTEPPVPAETAAPTEAPETAPAETEPLSEAEPKISLPTLLAAAALLILLAALLLVIKIRKERKLRRRRRRRMHL